LTKKQRKNCAICLNYQTLRVHIRGRAAEKKAGFRDKKPRWKNPARRKLKLHRAWCREIRPQGGRTRFLTTLLAVCRKNALTCTLCNLQLKDTALKAEVELS